MKQQIFAVRDQKTDQFAQPMFLITKAHAIRTFADAINNQEEKNNQLNMHAEDFELFHLGEYDSDTGIFETHAPKSVATALELKTK